MKALAESNPQDAGLAKEVRAAELELKKSKRKDFYKILSLEKDASENDIKKAYRRLAIVHHPDKNPDDEDAAGRFKEVGEAYETLSDPEKRARYDSGEDLIDPSEMFAGGMGGMNIPPEFIFNMMNGQGAGGFSFSSGGGSGGVPFGASSSTRRGGGGGAAGGFNY